MELGLVAISEVVALKALSSAIRGDRHLYPVFVKSLFSFQVQCDRKLIDRVSENMRDTLIEHVRESQRQELVLQNTRDAHRKYTFGGQ